MESVDSTARPSSRPGRRLITTLAEVLLCTLVVLSAAVRQPLASRVRARWHTCKASRMVESAGRLAREGHGVIKPSFFHEPRAANQSQFVQEPASNAHAALHPVNVFRSPPQA